MAASRPLPPMRTDSRCAAQSALQRVSTTRARRRQGRAASGSDLAGGAVEGGAPGPLRAPDGGPAPRARLALTPVDLVMELVPAGSTEQVDVLLVDQAAPPGRQRLVDHLQDRSEQSPHFLARQRVRQAVVAQPGAVEDLVAVDVAEP